MHDARHLVEYPRHIVRVPGIAMLLLLLAFLPLAHVHPYRSHGLAGLVQVRLDRLEAQRRARMTVPDRDHARWSWYPRFEDDRIDAIVGAIRVEWTHGVTSVAEDRPYGVFFAATEVPGAWLFASSDGVLYRARTFTGRLMAFGRIPRELRFHPESYGRMVLGDNHGRWWSTDGNSPLEAMAMDAHPLVMAFASSQRGAAVLQSGSLIATDDGGHSWHAVQTELIAFNVSRSPDGLIVETLDGLRMLLPDETLTPNVHVPRPNSTALDFLWAAQRVRSLELPSGGLERLQESAIEERRFHVQTFRCNMGLVERRPMVPMQRKLLGPYDVEGLGPAECQMVEAAGHQLFSVAWRGNDLAGDYAHFLRSVELPASFDNTEWRVDPLRLWFSTRGGVVIERGRRLWSLTWIGINGRVMALPPLAAAGVFGEEYSFQPLPNGGMVMYRRDTVAADNDGRLVPPRGGIPVTMLVAREVHVDGTVGDRIGVLLARDEGGVIAARHDGWGIAVLPPHAADDVLLYASDHNPPRSLGPIPTSDIPACGHVQPPDATLLWQHGGDNIRDASHQRYMDPALVPYLLQGAREAIELSTHGACLRRIEVPSNFEAHPELRMGGLRVDARPGNILVGTDDDGMHVRSVRCSGVADASHDAAANAH